LRQLVRAEGTVLLPTERDADPDGSNTKPEHVRISNTDPDRRLPLDVGTTGARRSPTAIRGQRH
jgi:hypothetical protein